MGKNKKNRRRITRRPSNQRSNTTPELSREPFTLADNEGSIALEPRTDREGLSSIPTSFQSFPAVTDSVACKHSSAASIGSDSSASTDGKKKHPLFSFKFKDNDRPKSSPTSPHTVSSPLPPDTPSKALEMLGFERDRTRTRSQSLGSEDLDDDELDEVLVTSTPTLKQKVSSFSLTSLKAWPVKDTKPKEQGAETDTDKAVKGFWEASTEKVQRMLGFRPKHVSSIKHETDSERSRIELPTLRLREECESYHSSGSDFQASLPSHLSAPRPVAETPPRRKRKKAPKSLDRMPPITEASHDESHDSYNDREHNTELELISEYEDDVPYPNGFRPPSRTSSLRQSKVWFKLDQECLSPPETGPEENNGTKGTELAVKSADEVDLKRHGHQLSATIPIRSPLQRVEDLLLDPTEANIAAYKAKLYENDVSRALMDMEVSALKESHRKMKAEFRAIRPDLLPLEESDSDGSEDEDEEDLVSIRSSIDLEEEPVICEAKVMTITRVTPGMVKLVDIPPRKQKHAMPSSHKTSPVPPSGTKLPLNATYSFQNEENPSPFKGRTREVKVRKYPSTVSQPTNTLQPTIKPSHLTLQKHNHGHNAHRVNIPRENSRILSQEWNSTYDGTNQRHLPRRPDAHVLTSPQIPAAPHLKHPPPPLRIPPPPPHESSKDHYCIKNGHILHPINLKTIPDEATINSLQVRPYLRTPAGRKEHIRVPVFCNKCGEDVEEEVWECEVAVCRLVCCRKCAMDMGREWKERATGAWKY
ncbi:uncharacterized protein yc1106_01077 [Curvularia clavata]|uniref:Uncharacterized protein n=1 Tax=Curvularia clavata TaxID=95742 RepID=A0A9Q8Z4H7_CURCL|nr:uncharacterized protein yc1106_01077 [Curvularia clavata]